ncbi:iron ABC transporter permease [Paenibacillus sp. PsM32]|uniref:Iron ABC transporter permease n=2 Tax=Paenibacillus TaxID=44249 RepID=A0AAX3M0S1_9BACL|nr:MULTISPECIES: iron ABC transporter permease [Paenibacillus]MDN4620281.1 iron ABC transporter permease [Paenibacillus sp. PsM32]MDQ1235979.1 iron complex transport system permease protein [Paenibacillus sp. SORGH_AS_0306]MDR6113027.1 iron complex transport system permease protein [Paenibacillus sp. SORGH_AS_0338]WCT55462.1 iron ABC transporter permease [Paenibacillus kyungheensis]
MNQAMFHRKRTIRTTITLIVLALIAFGVLLLSMNTGFSKMSPLEVLSTLFGGGTPKQHLILFEFRLPRIVIALLVGIGLAIAGAILQGVSRNGLADPGILGINSGAGLAVVLYVVTNPQRESTSPMLLPFLALIGAFAAAIIIYLMAYKRHKGISSARLVLSGIALAAGINALMIVLTIRLDPNEFNFIATWQAGSIWGSSWKFVIALLPWLIVLIPIALWKARQLDVFSLGDETATGLGSHLNIQRMILLVVAVAISAACVAVSGGIGFIGLLGPHIARRLVGPRYEHVIPVSALIGAVLLLTADMVGRSLLQNSEIPAGVMVAIIGAPYFLYLLARSKA